ncbi:MAG: peptidase S10 [Acidobacteriota bacterium]
MPVIPSHSVRRIRCSNPLRRLPVWAFVGALAALLLQPAAGLAEGARGNDIPMETPPSGWVKAPTFEDQASVTMHRTVIDGQEIRYTATAGTLVLRNAEGAAQASVFYVAYTRDGVDDPATRPVTFSFNGGPGAAAVWVHMGAFGPKKVLADPEGMPMPPPGKLVANPHSILDISDLVFIDPVGTGFSRPAPGVDGKKFWGLEGDIESVGETIRLWVTRNERWGSPKFLAGESYGTIRAAGLAGFLQQRYSMYLNGVVLISPVLNYQNQEFDVGNDMAYLTHLPTYAATARHHGRHGQDVPGDLQTLLDGVESFALGDYALALLKGDTLVPEERRRIAERVASYTGLPADLVLENNLRIPLWRFQKNLLRGERKVVGRLDSRYTFVDMDVDREEPEFDPSMTAVDIGYVTLLNDYLRRDLRFESDLVYESLNREVWPWDYSSHGNRYVNMSETLRGAMTRNPNLQVLFLCGYYDFATPYFDSVYTISHMGLAPEQRRNVDIAFYEAGHMMYVRDVDHGKLKRDLVEHFEKALGGVR